ncbi:hypothetical protein SAMN05444392_10835 [Seinonella peptonophila]|uniref:Uncharacterized protein n=2 Tax=Seinonella peptonophila TaxID=112248 RepID=A0A1M4Z4J0_9BACL|nr:hypothetical protein SAMN05444392_10835 [Seinonella peptonophila]
MFLSSSERGLVIRALTKILETEPVYARADEYRKLLARLKNEQQTYEDSIYIQTHIVDIDEA